MKMFTYHVSHLFKGNKINAKDTQLYLENIGIELTKSESEELLDTLPLDGKHFRRCSEFWRIVELCIICIKF